MTYLPPNLFQVPRFKNYLELQQLLKSPPKPKDLPPPTRPAFRTQDAISGGVGLLLSQLLGGPRAAQAFGQGYLQGKTRMANADSQHSIQEWQQQSLQEQEDWTNRVNALKFELGQPGQILDRTSPRTDKKPDPRGKVTTQKRTVPLGNNRQKLSSAVERLQATIKGFEPLSQNVETQLGSFEKQGVTFSNQLDYSPADRLMYLLRRHKVALLAEAQRWRESRTSKEADSSVGETRQGKANLWQEIQRIDGLLERARKIGGTERVTTLHQDFKQMLQNHPSEEAKIRATFKKLTGLDL